MSDTAGTEVRGLSLWRAICVSLPSAVVGSLLTLYAVTGKLVPQGLSYVDLAATLLAAVSVIIAIFGGVLAIAAFWGFEQMRVAAITAATEASVIAATEASVTKACEASVAASVIAATPAATGAAIVEVKEQIENGPLRAYMNAEIRAVIHSPDFVAELVMQARRTAFSREDDAELDAEEVRNDNG